MFIFKLSPSAIHIFQQFNRVAQLYDFYDKICSRQLRQGCELWTFHMRY